MTNTTPVNKHGDDNGDPSADGVGQVAGQHDGHREGHEESGENPLRVHDLVPPTLLTPEVRRQVGSQVA